MVAEKDLKFIRTLPAQHCRSIQTPVLAWNTVHLCLDADAPTLRKDGSLIPLVELKNRIPQYLWDNYIRLLSKNTWVACQNRLKEVDEMTINSLLDRLAWLHAAAPGARLGCHC